MCLYCRAPINLPSGSTRKPELRPPIQSGRWTAGKWNTVEIEDRRIHNYTQNLNPLRRFITSTNSLLTEAVWVVTAEYKLSTTTVSLLTQMEMLHKNETTRKKLTGCKKHFLQVLFKGHWVHLQNCLCHNWLSNNKSMWFKSQLSKTIPPQECKKEKKNIR